MNLPISMVLAATIAAAPLVQRYDAVESKQLVPMLSEVIRFATYEGNAEAHAAQKAWLMKTAADLGFTARDAGKVTEIELAADVPTAPVLGLVIHGDVVTVDEKAWSFPPFEGRVANGHVLGRGAADDKGPLIQALLAMKVLKESGAKRTHTVRLLIGSEEESSAEEMKEYLATHAAPDYSLVLDSEFPVVVGEKAWDALSLTTTLESRGDAKLPFRVAELEAGLAASIVPDRAVLKLVWTAGRPQWDPIVRRITNAKLEKGTHVLVEQHGDTLVVIAQGKAAHSGMNLAAGRNAILALAKAAIDVVPPGGARDLLGFAALAGRDPHGAGLGITDHDPVWGRYGVNVATIKPDKDDPKKTVLTINLRRIPPRTAPQIKVHLETVVTDFNARTGASLVAGGYFEDETFGRSVDAPLVQRLMAIYERATGTKAKPAISGGGTYAKRLPNAIAFGMWFPGKAYPGHDVDEKIAIADLHRGARVLIHALADLATGEIIAKPF
jgi:succinyl-diaminopimelate desuccinylase